MDALTAAASRTEIVSRTIQQFIEDGPLAQKIKDSQTPLYERMLFVDYDSGSAACRILLAGLDPNGYTNIQRNVIAMQYNESITSFFICDKFPFVKSVSAILSEDPDFENIVVSKGGRIRYSLISNKSVAPIEWITHYGDQHPNVESTMKSAIPNEGTTVPFPLSLPLNTSEFVNSYHLRWLLNDGSRVISRENNLLEGIEAIVSNSHLLPEYLSLQRLPTECCGVKYALVCYSAHFFADTSYKITTWNN